MPRVIDCRDCAGRGYVMVKVIDADASVRFVTPCDTCQGAGQFVYDDFEEDPSSERPDGWAKYLGLTQRDKVGFWTSRLNDRSMRGEFMYYDDEGPVWRFAGGWRLGIPLEVNHADDDDRVEQDQ